MYCNQTTIRDWNSKYEFRATGSNFSSSDIVNHHVFQPTASGSS
jgi:hypothetical protein